MTLVLRSRGDVECALDSRGEKNRSLVRDSRTGDIPSIATDASESGGRQRLLSFSQEQVSYPSSKMARLAVGLIVIFIAATVNANEPPKSRHASYPFSSLAELLVHQLFGQEQGKTSRFFHRQRSQCHSTNLRRCGQTSV